MTGQNKYFLGKANGGGASSPFALIFFGESNPGGYGLNSDASAPELAARPEIQILNNTTLTLQDLDIPDNNLIGHTGLTPGVTHGWELGLANEVAAGNWPNQSADNPVYLLKAAQGGSVIADWDDGDAYWETFEARWDAFAAAVPNAASMRVAIWFMLGINDAIIATPAATFKTGIAAIFARIRAKIGIPDAPIFIMNFMPLFEVYGTKIRELARELIDVYLVSSAGLALRDTIHFSYAGLKGGATNLVAATISHPAPPALYPDPTPVTWTGFQTAAQSGANLVLTGGQVTGGGRHNAAIVAASDWEVKYRLDSLAKSQGVIGYIDDDASVEYAFGPQNDYLGGIYNFAGQLYWTDIGGSGGGPVQTIAAYPCYIRFRKNEVGTGLLAQFSADNVTWSTIKTFASVLNAATPLYFKTLFANTDTTAEMTAATVFNP